MKFTLAATVAATVVSLVAGADLDPIVVKGSSEWHPMFNSPTVRIGLLADESGIQSSFTRPVESNCKILLFANAVFGRNRCRCSVLIVFCVQLHQGSCLPG
jgi:hypothetical protein